MPPKAPVKGKPKAVAKKDGAKPDPRDPQGIFSAQFDFLDANGDGMIDTKEFRHGLISAGWSQDELSDLFDKIDVSHDGKISREEYLNYHAKKESKAMSLDPKKVFEEMDQDKDQALNLRELAKLIRKVENEEGFLGDLDFSGYCKEQLAAADTDKDGKLNFGVFPPCASPPASSFKSLMAQCCSTSGVLSASGLSHPLFSQPSSCHGSRASFTTWRASETNSSRSCWKGSKRATKHQRLQLRTLRGFQEMESGTAHFPLLWELWKRHGPRKRC
eukprot:546263-Rhodomonas_salina.11